jgi:hypothetical protein
MKALVKQEDIVCENNLFFGDVIDFRFDYSSIVLIYPYDLSMFPKEEDKDELFIIDKNELRKFDKMMITGLFWRWGSNGHPIVKIEIDLNILRDKKINEILN